MQAGIEFIKITRLTCCRKSQRVLGTIRRSRIAQSENTPATTTTQIGRETVSAIFASSTRPSARQPCSICVWESADYPGRLPRPSIPTHQSRARHVRRGLLEHVNQRGGVGDAIRIGTALATSHGRRRRLPRRHPRQQKGYARRSVGVKGVFDPLAAASLAWIHLQAPAMDGRLAGAASAGRLPGPT